MMTLCWINLFCALDLMNLLFCNGIFLGVKFNFYSKKSEFKRLQSRCRSLSVHFFCYLTNYLLKQPPKVILEGFINYCQTKTLNEQLVFTISTWMQHMTYQPVHSVDPLMCVSYQRAADGSVGIDTELWHMEDMRSPTQSEQSIV